MAISKWIYRLSDGLFLYGGFYDPTFDSGTQGVATFPDANQPNPRKERYDGAGGKRAATQAEIDAWDASQIRYVDSRVMLVRMTADERFKLHKLAFYDSGVCQFMLLFLCRAGRVDVNDALSKQGWAYVKTVGITPPVEANITPIWPDVATADARIAAITA